MKLQNESPATPHPLAETEGRQSVDERVAQIVKRISRLEHDIKDAKGVIEANKESIKANRTSLLKARAELREVMVGAGIIITKPRKTRKADA